MTMDGEKRRPCCCQTNTETRCNPRDESCSMEHRDALPVSIIDRFLKFNPCAESAIFDFHLPTNRSQPFDRLAQTVGINDNLYLRHDTQRLRDDQAGTRIGDVDCAHGQIPPKSERSFAAFEFGRFPWAGAKGPPTIRLFLFSRLLHNSSMQSIG